MKSQLYTHIFRARILNWIGAIAIATLILVPIKSEATKQSKLQTLKAQYLECLKITNVEKSLACTKRVESQLEKELKK